MYVPAHFRYPADELAAMLASVGVGELVTTGPDGLRATLLPFSFDPDAGQQGVLKAHLARVNTQWHDEGPALVLLQGANAYVSPTIVPSAATSDAVVPTWNYLTMQVSGHLVAHDNPEWVLAALRELVDMHDQRWSLDAVAPAKLDAMLRAIVGVEIVIDDVAGKAKLSQNRSSADIGGIASALAASAHSAETAELMRELALPYATAREAAVEVAREGGGYQVGPQKVDGAGFIDAQRDGQRSEGVGVLAQFCGGRAYRGAGHHSPGATPSFD